MTDGVHLSSCTAITSHAEYCEGRVLYVCLSSHIPHKRHVSKLHEIFCTCYCGRCSILRCQ